jgi:magnesium transporter
MIKIYKKDATDSKIKELENFVSGSWIHVQNVNEEEMVILERDFKLDKNILKDALDSFEAPRMEVEDDVVYIFTRVAQNLDGRITTVPLLLAVGSNFFLTLSKGENPIFNKFTGNGLSFVTSQKTQFLLMILSEIIKDYNGFLTAISRNVREASGRVGKIDGKTIINFVNFEEELNDFLLALTHTSPVLQNILSGKMVKFYEEDEEPMEDLILSANQLINLCQSTLKNIVNIREAYSAIVTNDLNRVIKLFTSLTVILTIPTIIASLYGMNVVLPLAENPEAFWIISLLIVAIVSLVLYIFNRNRWL